MTRTRATATPTGGAEGLPALESGKGQSTPKSMATKRGDLTQVAAIRRCLDANENPMLPRTVVCTRAETMCVWTMPRQRMPVT